MRVERQLWEKNAQNWWQTSERHKVVSKQVIKQLQQNIRQVEAALPVEVPYTSTPCTPSRNTAFLRLTVGGLSSIALRTDTVTLSNASIQAASESSA